MTTEFIQIVFSESRLSYDEFAKKIDVKPATIRNWFKGLYAPSFVSQLAIRAVFRNEVKTAQIKTLK